MADSQSDDDYVEGDIAASDGESASGSDAEASSGSSDSDECAFNCDYDVEETGGLYAILLEEEGRIVTTEEHKEICGCDPDVLGSTHFRTLVQGGGDEDSDMAEVHDDDDSTFGDGDEE